MYWLREMLIQWDDWNFGDRRLMKSWGNWFCFGCLPSQSWMTKVMHYDGEGATNETTGEIYLCEDLAKELYGDDLNGPTYKYDKYGMYLYEGGTEASFEQWNDDKLVGDTDVEIREGIRKITEPSYFFKNADHFFSFEQFKPPFLRKEDGGNFKVVIVGPEWEKEQELLKTEKGTYF